MNHNLIRQIIGGKILKIIIFLLLATAFQSCFDYGYVDSDSFLGTWQLEGRTIYNGMTIQIAKENEKLKGYIVSKPNNQYGETLMKENSIWVSKIERGANYYFKVTEKKIAHDLFDVYNIDTNLMFYATFSEKKDTIYLSEKRPNRFTEKTTVYYKRVN